MNQRARAIRRVVKAAKLIALLPMLQASGCNVDLQSAFTTGLANFTILQATAAADVIFRNLLGV